MSSGNKGRLVFGVALLVSLPALWAVQPFLVRDWFTTCAFRAVTGYRCPLCGMTRALASAAHGQFRAAFDYHPLWPIVAVLIVCLGMMFVRDAVLGGNLAERTVRLAARGWLLIVVLLIVVAVWRAL